MGKFDGKVVLVSGGNRNTGLDLVEKFACEGAKVFMCGSSEASTAKGAAELKARGIDGIISQACDISDAVQGQVSVRYDRARGGASRHPRQQCGEPGTWAWRGAASSFRSTNGGA